MRFSRLSSYRTSFFTLARLEPLHASVRHNSTKSNSLSQKIEPSPLLENHRAIITGASRGIGLSVARLLSSHGASCVLISRTPSTLQHAMESLPSTAKPHSFLAGSVSDPFLWETIKINEKQIDILVNVAGISQTGLLTSTLPEVIMEVLETNLLGTILGARAVVKAMLRRKKGAIVNVASVYAVKGGRGCSIYAASKSGVVGFTRALADELGGSGIRVNCVSPGWIETEMTSAMTPTMKEKVTMSTPSRRMGTSEEVADAVLFLIKNQFANGMNLVLDGGVTAT